MDENVRAQIETYLAHLDVLMRRGRELYQALSNDPSNGSIIVATRTWQEDCGVTVNQLSGGSKAHWLARSFSGAFLMRSADGHAIEWAAPDEIVRRLLDVIEQAASSLSGMGDAHSVAGFAPASTEAPPPRRFEFVHNPELRPVLEQAYLDSRYALEQAEYDRAMRTFCGILEAIVTDSLEHKGLSALIVSGSPAEKIADWSFETRLTFAESVGLIRGGCARLPAVARTYRESAEDGEKTTVSERDARLAGQVLHVVMKDLDPGR